MIRKTTIKTPLGEMIACATADGICLLEFSEGRTIPSGLEDIARLFGTEVKDGRSKYLRQLKRELKEYFSGKRKEFSVPLVTPGSEFQISVWKQLREIPFGETVSYQKQAEKLKNPDSVRAVAHADATNRIAIVIPCHRVIGSDRKLVGYGGGIERKRWLINHEREHSANRPEPELF